MASPVCSVTLSPSLPSISSMHLFSGRMESPISTFAPHSRVRRCMARKGSFQTVGPAKNPESIYATACRTGHRLLLSCMCSVTWCACSLSKGCFWFSPLLLRILPRIGVRRTSGRWRIDDECLELSTVMTASCWILTAWFLQLSHCLED